MAIPWTVDGVDVDGIEGSVPTVTRGVERTATLLFEEASESATAFDERYRTLRRYLEYDPGPLVRRWTTDDGPPRYRERVPDDASVSTYVVDVEPDAGVADAEGFWAVVVGGETDSRGFGNHRLLTLDLFVLAELSEYADKSAVETAFGSEVV